MFCGYSYCHHIFKHQISKSYKEEKSIALTYKYITAHYPGFEQALQLKKNMAVGVGC